MGSFLPPVSEHVVSSKPGYVMAHIVTILMLYIPLCVAV